jgi:hypothetical protein
MHRLLLYLIFRLNQTERTMTLRKILLGIGLSSVIAASYPSITFADSAYQDTEQMVFFLSDGGKSFNDLSYHLVATPLKMARHLDPDTFFSQPPSPRPTSFLPPKFPDNLGYERGGSSGVASQYSSKRSGGPLIYTDTPDDPTPVPLPATIYLFGLGLASLWAIKKTNRQDHKMT